MAEPNNIPKLRFPEFEGEWNKSLFKDIFTFYSTNSLSRENLNYSSGCIRNIHYGDIHTKYPTIFKVEEESVPYINSNVNLKNVKSENYCKEGDLIIADASEDYADIGKTIEIISVSQEKILAGLHTFLARPKIKKTVPGFSGYLMKTWLIRKQLMIIAQGIKVLSISTSRLGTINVIYPSLLEQQKIASFLTAVDDKIQQLTKKKSLLEQYKKGVMQKIFKQEIRFKDDEGKEYPEWEEKKLGKLIYFENGKAHENNITENGNYIVVNSKFISTEGSVKKYSNKQICPLTKGSIVFVMSDVPKGKALAKCFYIDIDDLYTLNQRICALKPKSADTKFLYY